MDDLVIDGKLATFITDDKNSDATTSIVEVLGETGEEAALVQNGKALLNITCLGHGDDATVITDVQDTVLLENRTEHVLDNDRGRRVGNKRGLFIQLLGEEVNTKIAVLASLGRGGDADDLARTAL